MRLILYTQNEVLVMANPILYAEHRYTEQPDISTFTMHTHGTYEIYRFLSGNAKYFVEGTTYRLKPGDILFTKKAEAHSLIFMNDMPYERMFVHFNAEALLGSYSETLLSFMNDRPLGKGNYYPFVRFAEQHWGEYLDKICACTEVEEQRLYLTVLLAEMRNQTSCVDETSERRDALADIIVYINRHLTQDLSLDDLCEKFYISKSHLNRRFKRLTGSTVWEYIKTKRLVTAKELLQSGTHPTAVATQCGFREYSAFFYAYKAKFGTSPKQDFVPSHE